MAAVVLMGTPGMAGLPPLHEGAEGIVSMRLQHDVEMIGHETEAKDAYGEFGFGGRKQVKESG